MTSIEWADLARSYTAILSMLLIVLFGRLGVQRALRYGIRTGVNPHPLTSVGLMLVFGTIVYRRQATLGMEGEPILWLSVAYCTMTMLGMCLAVTWRLPPFMRRKSNHRRRDDR